MTNIERALIGGIIYCDWCKHVAVKGRRFECYLIDDDGNTAPECIRDNLVQTLIAEYCPKCGRPLCQEVEL